MTQIEREAANAWLARWQAEMPEGKLELIDGQLIITTHAGSRRVLRELLLDYGPPAVLAMAPDSAWWSALEAAFQPQPWPQTRAQWHRWADNVDITPVVSPAGPEMTDGHYRLRDRLRWALHAVCEHGALGRWFDRDFVVRLGEDGLTPDILVIDPARLPHLHERYLNGPPALIIEITTPASLETDRALKRQKYAHAGVPDYWLIEPEAQRLTLHRLQPEGDYQTLVYDQNAVEQLAMRGQDRFCRCRDIPELMLSLNDLWSSASDDHTAPWRPFRQVAQRTATGQPHAERGGITWDSVPFQPRVDLDPVPIQFAEYAAWCPRAKFERYGDGLKIDGTEGTRRVAGMLLMSLGLKAAVELLHPRDWLAFLDRERYQPALTPHVKRWLAEAQIEQVDLDPDPVFRARVAAVPDLDTYDMSPEHCRKALAQRLTHWGLLRLARREPLP